MSYRKTIAAPSFAHAPHFAAPTAVALGFFSPAVSSSLPLPRRRTPNWRRSSLPPIRLGSGLFDMVTPVTVVNRKEISDRGASTLGEALEGVPGVSASNFGPNASRP